MGRAVGIARRSIHTSLGSSVSAAARHRILGNSSAHGLSGLVLSRTGGPAFHSGRSARFAERELWLMVDLGKAGLFVISRFGIACHTCLQEVRLAVIFSDL